MDPPNLGQALDDEQTPSQEIDHDEVYGSRIDGDMLFSRKSSPQVNVICKDNINHNDGVTNVAMNEFPYDEDSVDSLDSPGSVQLTDSGEEFTDDEDQPPAQQPLGAVAEGTGNIKNSCWEYTARLLNVPSRRRPLHEIQGIHQYEEQNFPFGKDQINKFIEKLSDKDFINKELFFVVLMAAFVVILSLIYYVSPVNESSPKSPQYYISEEIINHYPTQDRLDLKNLVRVIYNVKQGKYETDKVAVITILYSHRETAECLAKTAANYAVKVINRNEDFVRLNGSLSNADFYLGNEGLKKDIEGKGVLVVYDFHNFPAEKVRYFHAIFDKHTPFIEDKAVYIILLEMSKNQEEISKKLEKVQSRIEELWYALKSEVLNPLGTRLMDNVLVVQREPKLLWC